MKKLIVGSLIATALYVSLFSNFNQIHQDLSNDGGVFICEDTGEEGPIFYPAEYSSEITNEPNYSTQNGYTFSSMNYNNAHKYYRGDSVKVAVIDSGLNYTHEDFKDSSNNQIIQGNSRTIDNSSGSWLYYQFSSGYQSKIVDSLGHGTNVASVIASQINALGCAGIAPNVELYVYKVTNTSNGYEWTAINSALSYCISEGIDVINMSFQAYEHAVTYNGSTMSASTGCSSVMTSYINSCYNAGITLVAAAGNYNTSEPSYPASNNHVFSVGSLAESSTTTKAAYSNTYGIDLVAPGTVYVADKGTNSSYKKTSGTSFSAPIVTAAIALYKQQHPTATPSEIESALYASCDSISGNPSWAGNGRLNIDKFLGVDFQDAPVEIVINNPEVVNEELELEIGDYLDLDWTVNGVGTFDDSVNFYTLSGENNVVSVNSSGRITATGTGSDYVVIESNADSSVYASVYVTVTSSGSSTPTVTSVTVTPSSLNLDLNGTTTGTLTATVNGTYNPSQAVTWTSSNTSVAMVSALGVVTAKATGNATVTATSQADGTKSGTCTVTVTDSTVHVSSVSLNKNSTTICVGDSETLVATVSPNNATNKSVTWTSSNTSIATVAGGTVTGVATGNATITVKTDDGNKTATCTVTVSAASTQTLTITRSSFATSGGYAWYDWTQATSDSTSISGKGELYTTTTASMQFNKSKGNKVAAVFNTTAIPGSITKIEATSQQTTIRSWTAYVTSTSCSASGTTLTFGSNKTTVGTVSPAVGTSTTFGTSSAGYSYFCLQENDSSASYLSEIKITYVPKALSSISVKTAPTKTIYEAGECFDPTGLVITKTFSDNSTQDLAYTNDTATQFTFTPDTSTPLTTSNIAVTIVVGGKSTSQTITVNEPKVLSSISISGQTTSFVEGDTFSFGGTVTAHYTDLTTADVTSETTFSGYSMTSVGSQTVTVSYGGKSTSYSITISQGTLSSIAVSGQTTTYQKNNAFSFDGTCTATFTNGYQKTVTPTSVTSPDMSTGGVKSITVSFTYNGTTKTTSYDITVNSDRVVIETTTTTGYSVIGTITYPSNTQTISTNTLSVSTSGFAGIESNAIRLGSSGNTGTVTVTSTTSNITKVVVSAKAYGTDTGVTLTVGGTSNTITSSYADYVKEYTTATNSVAIATTTNKKRAYIQTITVYETKTTTIETDISQSEDCVGLETFISTYMHMDYVQNLGYCKDSEHHYYSSAREAFNDLNEHQRSLFTANSAYLTEWTRLSTWASKNGDSLNSNNILASRGDLNIFAINKNTNIIGIIVIISVISASSIGAYFMLKRRKEIK